MRSEAIGGCGTKLALVGLLLFVSCVFHFDASDAHASNQAREGFRQEPTESSASEPIDEDPEGEPNPSEPDVEADEDVEEDADEDFDFGDDDEDEAFDFGDEGQAASPAELAPSSSSVSTALTGFLRSDWAIWAERLEASEGTTNPWSKGRQSLDLNFTLRYDFFRLRLAGHVEYDLAYLYERDAYEQETLESYEWKVNTREAEMAFSVGDFEFTLGRQIVAWGEGDMLSPLDVVNPRDLREPGGSDLADLRLPILATRVGWYLGDHRLEAMVIHESDFGYRSPPKGPFSPFDTLMAERMSQMIEQMSESLGEEAAGLFAEQFADKRFAYRHLQNRFALEQQEVFLRWLYKGAGVDLGGYAATFLDRQGVIAAIEAPSSEGGFLSLDEAGLGEMNQFLAAERLTISLDHPRYFMLGHSGAFTYASFLFKWEFGAEFDRRVMLEIPPAEDAFAPMPSFGVAKVHLINTQVGITWSGVQDLVLAFEISSPFVIDPPPEMLFDIGTPTFATRASYLTLKERLQFQAAALFFGWHHEMGWLVQGVVSYEVLDGFEINLAYVSYQPGTDFGPLYGLETHDRLSLKLRWDFQIF